MRGTRQRSVAPNGGEALTLQQVMETMRALQEEMVASRANQERIQVDLVASQATSEELRCLNEELRRDLQTHVAEREGADQEPVTPPREFPTPFSLEIVDAVIPTTLVGPKVTLAGTTMDWFISLPDGHVTSFPQLTKLFKAQYLANRAPSLVSCDLFDVRQYQGESLKEFLHRFGAQVMRLNLTKEKMMLHAFRKGIVSGSFC